MYTTEDECGMRGLSVSSSPGRQVGKGQREEDEGGAPDLSEWRWTAQTVWPQRRVVGSTRRVRGGQQGQHSKGTIRVGSNPASDTCSLSCGSVGVSRAGAIIVRRDDEAVEVEAVVVGGEGERLRRRDNGVVVVETEGREGADRRCGDDGA
jgi:hypothetical protein